MAVNEGQIQGIYEDVEALKAQVAALEALTAMLQTDVSTNANNIAALQTRIITVGTNLNDLDLGHYQVPNTTVSNSLINSPIANGATAHVEVLRAGGDWQMIQIFRPCKKDNPTYYQRCYYNDGWGEWHTITN